MLESRFHGLGGQGVVLSTHLLGSAALKAGLWAHSFPFFTTAMRGGTVTAYTRIAKNAIDERCFIYNPDILILFHENLLYMADVINGIKPEGNILVNTEKKSLKGPDGFEGNLFVVDALKIADITLGRPILSTVMAGAFLQVQEMLTIDLLLQAINEQFSTKLASKNLMAAEQGYVHTYKV